jgi:hypothetical protein
MYKYYVIVDGERVDVEQVTVMDVQSDFQGRDVLTFEYRGKIHESNVFRY